MTGPAILLPLPEAAINEDATEEGEANEEKPKD